MILNLDDVWNSRWLSRQQVSRWIEQERMNYADVKYADREGNRTALIEAMHAKDWERWTNFLGNYLKRAELFGLDTLEGRQAMGKAAVTALHILETAVSLFGDMPKPGVASGTVEDW